MDRVDVYLSEISLLEKVIQSKCILKQIVQWELRAALYNLRLPFAQLTESQDKFSLFIFSHMQ